MKGYFGMVLVGMLVSGSVQAQVAESKNPAPAAKAEQTAAPAQMASTAEIQLGTGYDKFAVVGEATSFPAGTLVFAVSTVTGAEGTSVKHVWKKDGAELWTASLNIGSSHWRTSSRRLMSKPGTYEVSVVASDGTELGKSSFTVQ